MVMQLQQGLSSWGSPGAGMDLQYCDQLTQFAWDLEGSQDAGFSMLKLENPRQNGTYWSSYPAE